MNMSWDKKTGSVTIKWISDQPIKLLDIIKILIIGFFSIYILGSAVPFYFGSDTVVYGITVSMLSEGSFEYTNELMQRFDGGPFLPAQWSPTVHGTAVPKSSMGIIAIGFIAHLIGGQYALFYVGPIATILLFIFTERITTRFFGGFAGLVALILVATDFKILEVGHKFLTDNIFTIFVILGSYYLVKFFHERKEKYILLCSVFFTLSTLMRINGVIFFPVEILLVSFYSLYLVYSRRVLNKNLNNENSQKNTISNNITKLIPPRTKTKIFKICFLLFIPWLIFFSFQLSYNSYYFGDPLTTYLDTAREHRVSDVSVSFASSFLIFDTDRLDWIKYYAIGSMPDRIKYGLADALSIGDVNFTDAIHFDNLRLSYNNWFSIFTFIIILAAIGISYIYKTKRIEVSVFALIILGTLLFYSTSAVLAHGEGTYAIVEMKNTDVQERYMLSNLVLTSMLFGFVMIKVYEINFRKISPSKGKIISKAFKIIFLIILVLLLFVSIFYSKPMLQVYDSTFRLGDLRGYVVELPLESGEPEKSIFIVQGRVAVLYDMIPFSTSTTIFGQFEPKVINDDEIAMLIQVMDEGYNVYSPEKLKPENQLFFMYLEQKHGLISKTTPGLFCKIEKISDVDSDPESNERCYPFQEIEYPK